MTQSSAPPISNGHRFLRVAIGVLAVGILCTLVQLAANLGFDGALTRFETAAAEAEQSRTSLVDDLSALDEAITAGTHIAADASDELMDVSLKDSLISAIGDAATDSQRLAVIAEEQIPRTSEKPRWAWELIGVAAQLDADRETAAQLIVRFDSASEDAVITLNALDKAGSSALISAADASEAFESAHVSARNPDIVALRSAAERVLDAADALDATASSAYADLETAVVQMLDSEHAELMERAGPLNDARAEVEAFARSLAPGLLLDFDWSPLVNGYGYSDSMGGYATWWYGSPGYANIELSNSVAEYWPGDRSEALVAHEVGHAISVRCDGMYDDSSQELIEDWATAWAISMGYLSSSNGTATYGSPSQELIDAAAGCR